jgi:uncharacterized membrane protein
MWSLRTIGLVIHVFGMMMWVGNLFANANTLVSRVKEKDASRRAALAGLARGSMIMMDVGMTLTLVGAAMLVVPQFSFYLTQKWLHVKVTLVVVLAAIHVFIRMRFLRVKRGGEITFPPPIVGALSLLVLGILVMVLVKPF